MRLVLDAGALIGIDRADRRMTTLTKLARRAGAHVVTTPPVVGQVWRDGTKQARLARALSMVDIRVVTLDDAKDAGELLRKARATDVVDALLAMQVVPGDQVLTSDPDDIERLLRARGVKAQVITV